MADRVVRGMQRSAASLVCERVYVRNVVLLNAIYRAWTRVIWLHQIRVGVSLMMFPSGAKAMGFQIMQAVNTEAAKVLARMMEKIGQ